MSSETYSPPLTVHVFWSAEGDNSIRPQLGRALYEFLCRPLDSNAAVCPGVGIPVRVGHHAEHVAALAKEAVADRGEDRPCLVAVPLLDSASRVDESFCEAIDTLWKAGGERGWPRVLILPVLLDQAWSVPDEMAPCRSAVFVPDGEKVERAVEEVSVGIGHFLMDREDGQRKGTNQHRRIRIFISHAKSGLAATSNLAERLRDHLASTEVKSFFDGSDIARGRSVGQQLEEAGRDAVFLSLRTDAYSGSPYCLDEVLTAKKHGVPTVCVHALSESELRSLTYGGNAFTYVSKASDDEPKAITALCLQAWLRHLHFHYAAPAIFTMRNVPLVPHYLSRPPELIDFAQNLLPREAATLVVYPDPPLPQAEVAVIRGAYPKVRLATPSTLNRELLRRIASPSLDGVRIALSLSDSPDIAEMGDLSPERANTAARGLTDAHLKDATQQLTLSLIAAGAELGYGGNLSNEGFTTVLSELIEAHKRTTKSSRDLLFNYVAAYLWDPAAAEKISARFIRIKLEKGRDVPADIKSALELAAMRKRMAKDCHARVIMGGKAAPKAGSGGKSGYAGRLPGQAEEAWRHLELDKPVFVVGGFGGCARLVADALCGKVAALPSESAECEASATYREFCEGFEREAPRHGLETPGGLDGLWAFFAERGKGFFHEKSKKNDADENMLWTNGLTVTENRSLFASTHPEEISALVHLGLQRLRDQERAKGITPLRVLLFQGSITDAPEVDSYAVSVLRGAPLRGADGALDAAMDGAIRRHLEQQKRESIVAVKGGWLPGDYVILQTVGDLSDLAPAGAEQEKQWLIERIKNGMADMVVHALRLGLDSPALVPFGSNLGLGVAESVLAMIEALVAENAGIYLKSVTLCEVDPERYREIVTLKNETDPADGDPSAAGTPHPLFGKVQITELRSETTPVGRLISRPAILLDVRRRGGDLIVHARAAGSGTAVAIEEKTIDWAKIMKLTHAFGKGQPPRFELQPSIGLQLAEAVLPAQARDAIAAHPDTPIDVLHDVEAGAIPFELLCLPSQEGRPTHWPALAGGIRRCLLTHNIPRRNQAHPRGAFLRLLIIVNPTDDLPHAEEEAKMICDAFLERHDVFIESPLVREAATYENVFDHLRKKHFDILHFAGHADFNARDRSESGLILADRKLRARDLTEAKLDQLPTLVVLNACEAGRVRAEAPEPPPDEKATLDASVAETILTAGIQGFISNLWKVDDRAGAEFSVMLYGGLAAGRTLGEAFLDSRRKLFESKQRDWLNYMLFGEAELRL